MKHSKITYFKQMETSFSVCFFFLRTPIVVKSVICADDRRSTTLLEHFSLISEKKLTIIFSGDKNIETTNDAEI